MAPCGAEAMVFTPLPLGLKLSGLASASVSSKVFLILS